MRSLAYWPGDKVRAPRILFGTEEGELYALDAKTGTPVEEFGAHGIVNLKTPEVMKSYPACTTGSPPHRWFLKTW